MPDEFTIPAWPVYLVLGAVLITVVPFALVLATIVPLAKRRARRLWGSEQHWTVGAWFPVACILGGPIGWYVLATRGGQIREDRQTAKAHGFRDPDGTHRAWSGHVIS
jgi:hypothetical protein